MPDPDSEQHGHSARLLRALIWGGVGLAPVTALVVLVGGSDNSVRFAVVLIAVCVVLIGASMLIRSDPVLLRMHVEDRVGEEVEALRAQLREEIAAAARVTSHRVQALEEELSQVRAGALAAPMGSARPEPGLPTGGRAVVPAAGATSGPIQRPAAVGRPTGGAAAAVNAVGPAGSAAPRPAGSASVSAAARPVGTASGPIPAPRAGAVVPPPTTAPVFRPSSGSPSTSSGAAPAPRGTGSISHEAGPAPRGTGSMSHEAGPASRGTGSMSHEAGPASRGTGSMSRGTGSVPRGTGPTSRGTGPHEPSAGPMPLNGGAGASRRPAGGAYGSPRNAESDQDSPGGEPSSGKRRADETAVDLGYTGRRSRASHATADDSYEADEDTSYSGYGAPAPDEYGPDPMAERFENWRQSTDDW